MKKIELVVQRRALKSSGSLYIFSFASIPCDSQSRSPGVFDKGIAVGKRSIYLFRLES
jgi:hypothetical protein